LRVFPGDFLEKIPGLELEMFDRILMNPPFDHGSDIVHIQHARKFLKPGGRLVAICAGGPKQAEILKPLSNFWEELPAGTFEGTQVRSVLLVIEG
jgi:16S rRNA G1207 methylase RsmC